MKLHPRTAGLIQAAGLTLYVTLFAFGVRHLQSSLFLKVQVSPTAGIVLFLLAFVMSTTICGSIVLGYPIFLFFNGRRADAGKTVAWSIIWLIVILAIIATVTFLVAPAAPLVTPGPGGLD